MSFTPVTFGDVVRDLRRGFSICSGDLLMLELARAFRPERALFVADVDGLFTADPKTRKSARLLEAVKPSDLPQVKFRAASRTDVTGSIEGKVRRMFEIAEHPTHFPLDAARDVGRSEEHTSELQSRSDLVCRLLLEKKKI